MPAFYNQPQTIDDLVNHSVGRVLDLFDIDVGILKRWEGPVRQANQPADNEKPDEPKTPYTVIGSK